VPARVPQLVLQVVPLRVPVRGPALSPGTSFSRSPAARPGTSFAARPGPSPAARPALSRYESHSVPVRAPMRVPQRVPLLVLQQVPLCPGTSPGVVEWHCESRLSRYSATPGTRQVPAPRLSKSRYEFRPLQVPIRVPAVGVLEYFFPKFFLSVGRKEGRGGTLVHPGLVGQKER
jgi:hypothetical protein